MPRSIIKLRPGSIILANMKKDPILHPKKKVCPNKECPHQGEEQPIENFTRQLSARDGRAWKCKDCQKIDTRKRKEKKSEYNFLKYF